MFPTEDMKELLNRRQTYCSSNLSLGTGGNLARLKMSRKMGQKAVAAAANLERKRYHDP